MATAYHLVTQIEARLLARNQVIDKFFLREAPRLALACRDLSERFLQGRRLLAFGRGPYATDAQHVSVKFVHPVIVGKRALPALDLQEEAEQISTTALAIRKRLLRGGKLILFGNGGSATDANDWTIDCVLPPSGYRPIPAVSLALEPANITAVANDVGSEVIFLRQLIAQARPEDVAIGIFTSGGSRNIIAALAEARRRDLLTVALLGYDGGEVLRQGLADHSTVVPCDYIPRIQEVQASIYHIMRETLEVLDRGHA